MKCGHVNLLAAGSFRSLMLKTNNRVPFSPLNILYVPTPFDGILFICPIGKNITVKEAIKLMKVYEGIPVNWIDLLLVVNNCGLLLARATSITCKTSFLRACEMIVQYLGVSLFQHSQLMFPAADIKIFSRLAPASNRRRGKRY